MSPLHDQDEADRREARNILDHIAEWRADPDAYFDRIERWAVNWVNRQELNERGYEWPEPNDTKARRLGE